jgi:two-component sensor histidine kinase
MPLLATHEMAGAEDFRQLRQMTKNALQRILATISETSDLHGTRAGRALSEDLQERILTAAKLSDALFGFVRHPGSLRDRLLAVSDGLVDLLGDDAATIRVAVAVQCHASAAQDDLLVRVAHELIGNSIKHGMHQRLLGRIRIEAQEEDGQIILTVTDDGWGLDRDPTSGEGLSIVDALLRPVNGTCQLRRAGQLTVARVTIPCDADAFVRLQPAS